VRIERLFLAVRVADRRSAIGRRGRLRYDKNLTGSFNRTRFCAFELTHIRVPDRERETLNP